MTHYHLAYRVNRVTEAQLRIPRRLWAHGKIAIYVVHQECTIDGATLACAYYRSIILCREERCQIAITANTNFRLYGLVHGILEVVSLTEDSTYNAADDSR